VAGYSSRQFHVSPQPNESHAQSLKYRISFYYCRPVAERVCCPIVGIPTPSRRYHSLNSRARLPSLVENSRSSPKLLLLARVPRRSQGKLLYLITIWHTTMGLASTYFFKSPHTRDVVGIRARGDPPANNPCDVSRRRTRDSSSLLTLSLDEYFTGLALGPTEIVSFSFQQTCESWVVYGHGLFCRALTLSPEGLIV